MADAMYPEAVSTARDYYNSEDADQFYATIWGGEDIHVGMYESDEEPIFEASRRTVAYMASKLALAADSRVLDIGAGYGGAARFLARTYGCTVTALNLSEVENDRNREMNRQQDLDHLIAVVDGSFEEISYPNASFDAVWSQDAILHSGDRDQVLREVYRVLKSGGSFIFTDPMQADDCPDGVLQPILDRIHLNTLGSPKFYINTGKEVGFSEVSFEDHTPFLAAHYSRVLQETECHEDRLAGVVSDDYIARMKKGLQHWIDGGKKGYLSWGVFEFKKS